MNKFTTLFAVAALMTGAQAAPMVSYQTVNYRCDMGQRVSVKYLNFEGNSFASVTYRGKHYGLGQAVSASGVRYTGMGMNLSSGLEWVQWHGMGFLNSFPINNPDQTRVVLNNCKVLR